MERSIILTTLLAIAVFVLILELVRQRALREEYSLLWLGTASIMILVSVWRDLLHGLASFMGIAYPPNLLFLMASIFMALMLLYFSTVITRLTGENKDIAQEVALLRHEIESLRTQQHRKQQESEQADTEIEDIS